MDPNSPRELTRAALAGFALAVPVVGLTFALGENIWFAIVPTGAVAAALRISNYRRRRLSAIE